MKAVNTYLDENKQRLLLTIHTSSYADSFAISMKAFTLAEKMNHHPIVTTEYSRVLVEICTHDEGNRVTNLDREYIHTLLNEI